MPTELTRSDKKLKIKIEIAQSRWKTIEKVTGRSREEFETEVMD